MHLTVKQNSSPSQVEAVDDPQLNVPSCNDCTLRDSESWTELQLIPTSTRRQSNRYTGFVATMNHSCFGTSISPSSAICNPTPPYKLMGTRQQDTVRRRCLPVT